MSEHGTAAMISGTWNMPLNFPLRRAPASELQAVVFLEPSTADATCTAAAAAGFFSYCTAVL